VVNAIDLPIIGNSNQIPQDDPSFTLNFYAEKISDKVLTLKPTPGSEVHAQFSVSGGGRGLITAGGRIFGVRGGYFQEMVNGVPLIRGNLLSLSGPLRMIASTPPDTTGIIQVMIVDEAHGYVFQLDDNSFTILTEADGFLGGGSQVAYCAGRAVVFRPGTTYWQISGLNNFRGWNTTAYASAYTLATPLLAVVANGDLCYFFSSDGFEVWQDQGLEVQPLQRVLSGDKIGILAPQSVLIIERYVYWLAKTSTGEGVVYRHTGGGAPERISDHSTERQIAALASPSDCVGDTYSSLGHVFYLLTFRQGNKTLCWDKTTNLWHNRCQREPVSGVFFALPYFSLIIFQGDIFGIHYQNGKMIRLDNELYQDEGNPIVRDRILAVVPEEADQLVSYQSAELFGQIGNTPVDQEDPKLMLRYSYDRGETWSNEMWQQAGGNSTYAARTRWVGLGSAFGISLWFRVVANQYVSWRSVRMRAR
jgi:hypothetical protein